MSGQIPPYGENFRHGRVGTWNPIFSDTIYQLKANNEWFIRSDKKSKKWYVFVGWNRDMATRMGKVQPSLTKAMQLLLDGIAGEFYDITGAAHAPDCGLQGSGLNKRCTCGIDEKAASNV
jgi:hypothetical protein